MTPISKRNSSIFNWNPPVFLNVSEEICERLLPILLTTDEEPKEGIMSSCLKLFRAKYHIDPGENGTNVTDYFAENAIRAFVANEGARCGKNPQKVSNVEILLLITAFVMLGLSIIGILGNAMSAWIFTRPSMRSPINILLTGLSLIDLALVLLVLPVLVLPAILRSNLVVTGGREFLRHYKWVIVRILYPVMAIAQTSSNWIFILISAERYIAVCRPFHSSRYATKRKAVASIILVLLMAALYNMVRFWEYTGEKDIQHLLRKNPLYVKLYYSGMYLLFHFLLPFGTLLVLNVCILSALRQDRLFKDCPSARRHHKNPSRRRSSTTLMIVVVTGIFAVCNIPPFVLNIWEAFASDQIFHQRSTRIIATSMFSIGNLLVTFNSASTFIVYLGFCQRYRALFRSFPCGKESSRQSQTQTLTHTCRNTSETKLSRRRRSLRASLYSTWQSSNSPSTIRRANNHTANDSFTQCPVHNNSIEMANEPTQMTQLPSKYSFDTRESQRLSYKLNGPESSEFQESPMEPDDEDSVDRPLMSFSKRDSKKHSY